MKKIYRKITITAALILFAATVAWSQDSRLDPNFSSFAGGSASYTGDDSKLFGIISQSWVGKIEEDPTVAQIGFIYLMSEDIDPSKLVFVEELNFGRVPARDLVVKPLRIHNISIADKPVEYRINSLEHDAGDIVFTPDVSIPTAFRQLGPGETDTILTTFAPNRFGARESTVDVTAKYNNTEKNVEGKIKGLGGAFKVEPKDFGKIYVGQKLRNTIRVVNVHDGPIDIIAADVENLVGGDFKLRSGQFRRPIKLDPLDTAIVVVEYKTDETGLMVGKISPQALIGGETDETSATFTARGEDLPDGAARVTLGIKAVPDVARPGDPVRVAIFVVEENGLFEGIGDVVSGKFTYNKNMIEMSESAEGRLVPVDIGESSSNYIERDFVGLSRESHPDTILTNLIQPFEARAMLTDDDVSTLSILNFEFIDDDVVIVVDSTLDGELRIETCDIDGNRLIKYQGSGSQLYQAYPNPAFESTRIDYSLLEEGPTKLYLVDVFGRVAKTLLDESAKPGAYSAYVRIDDNLPSGTYFIILETPSERFRNRLQVIK